MELLKKEGEYIRSMECVNKHIAGRSKKEGSKEYRKNNIKIIKEKAKEYYKKNKEKYKQYYEEHKEEKKEEKKEYDKKYTKIKITCSCGSIISKKGKNKHMKSKKHLDFLDEETTL